MAVAFSLHTPQVGEERALAAFHLKIWRETYRGVVPAEAAESLGLERRVGRWQDMLAAPQPGSLLQVVLHGRDYAGFCYAGEAGLPLSAAGARYITSMSIRPFMAEASAGALWGWPPAIFRRGAKAGSGLVSLPPTTGLSAFTRPWGASPARPYTDPGPIWRSANIAYFWDDLPALIARSGPAETVFG